VGDVLVAEPATASIVVVDRTTGQKTVISQGGLLAPVHKSVGVALAVDGTIIVAHRVTGLIRVHPVTGAQTVLSQGGLFKDPWAVVVNQITGDIYVADSGYDFDRPEINGAGKIIRVDPVSGVQQLIASGSTCTFFPANAACQNTTTAGSYLAHPYGIAIDYTTSPATLVVADMSSFNGNGAIFRLQAVPNGAQTLLWGPATAVPAPRVSQQSPLACPMGVAVDPNGNILTSVFSYPVPNQPVIPVSSGTFYGCTPGGIHRIDLVNSVQSVVSANAPQWEATRSYVVGDVIADLSGGSVHRVVSSGVSQDTFPNWNGTVGGTTADGSVVWRPCRELADSIRTGCRACADSVESVAVQHHRRRGRLRHGLPAGGEWRVHAVTRAARHRYRQRDECGRHHVYASRWIPDGAAALQRTTHGHASGGYDSDALDTLNRRRRDLPVQHERWSRIRLDAEHLRDDRSDRALHAVVRIGHRLVRFLRAVR
jgi:sugar lactone lactonase YvrE